MRDAASWLCPVISRKLVTMALMASPKGPGKVTCWLRSPLAIFCACSAKRVKFWCIESKASANAPTSSPEAKITFSEISPAEICRAYRPNLFRGLVKLLARMYER